MTQQPFSRPGAIDLSGAQAPSPRPPAAPAVVRPPPARPPAGSAYSLDVTEENFQQVLESSMTAPVLLVFFSRTQDAGERSAWPTTWRRSRASSRAATSSGSSTSTPSPQIAQAMQIPSIPLVVAVVDGRPMPLFQDVVPLDELRTALTQVGQQLTAQGITGRHQPRGAAPAAEGDEEPQVDPRYAAAQDALGEGDIDLAVAEYQKLVDANPADTEAAAGLAMAKVLQRTQGADLNAARAAAAAAPDDVDAQTLVADLDLLGGHVEDAFNRLVDARRAARVGRRPRPRPATTCSGSSPPSATTTSACSPGAATSRPRCSDGLLLAAERRPAGLEPRDRHPERRAGDVVEPDLVEEVDRRGSPPCSPQTPRCRSGLAARPSVAARRTSAPTPSTSRDSNGETGNTPCSR